MWPEFIIICTVITLTLSEDNCKTPNNEDGICKSIVNCPPLFSIVEKKQLNYTNIEFLKKHHCGFEKITPKVCCKNETTPSPTKESVYNILPHSRFCGGFIGDRLIGVANADLAEFRWLTRIEYEKPDKTRNFLCAGILINHRYVLFAAHCLKKLSAEEKWNITNVVLGEYQIEQLEAECNFGSEADYCTTTAVNITVEEIIIHEKYNGSEKNLKFDIGLLRLTKDVPFSYYVGPICLPISETQRNKSYEDLLAYVSGWRKNATYGYSKIKLKIGKRIIGLQECQEKYKKVGVVLDNSQICAEGEENVIDTCNGDIGGPLMTVDDDYKEPAWLAIGMESFGPCDNNVFPGVYTRLSHFVDWIISKIRK